MNNDWYHLHSFTGVSQQTASNARINSGDDPPMSDINLVNLRPVTPELTKLNCV